MVQTCNGACVHDTAGATQRQNYSKRVEPRRPRSTSRARRLGPTLPSMSAQIQRQPSSGAGKHTPGAQNETRTAAVRALRSAGILRSEVLAPWTALATCSGAAHVAARLRRTSTANTGFSGTSLKHRPPCQPGPSCQEMYAAVHLLETLRLERSSVCSPCRALRGRLSASVLRSTGCPVLVMVHAERR